MNSKRVMGEGEGEGGGVGAAVVVVSWVDSRVLQAFSVRLGSLRVEEDTEAFPMLPAVSCDLQGTARRTLPRFDSAGDSR